MNDLISIIIPTFNRKIDILDRSVYSVSNQSYSNIEIIIVDDNLQNSILSNEIKRYCSEKNIIYVNTNRGGAAVARNSGAKQSHGKFLAFLDDDDEWLNSKLQLQYALFTDENVGLVYCRGYTITVANSVCLKSPYATDSYFKESVTYEDLLLKNYIGTTSQIIVRKQAFDLIGGFDETFPARQDYDVCLRISKLFKCVGVDDYLFVHYLHEADQITKNYLYGMIGYKKIFYKYKGDLKMVPDAYRRACYRIARCALCAKQYLTFFKFTSLAILKNPLKLIDTVKKVLN